MEWILHRNCEGTEQLRIRKDFEMDQPIIISVIVPVYNIFEYLPRCVDSIRKQTYPYLDIILVDDGSTDRTGALAEKLALEDKRIRVFHKENGGSSSARNLGIAQAKGLPYCRSRIITYFIAMEAIPERMMKIIFLPCLRIL